MKKRALRWLLIAGRVLLAAVLLSAVLRRMEWRDTASTDSAGRIVVHAGTSTLLRAVNPALLVTATACVFLATFLIAWRWRVLLAVQKIRLAPGTAYRLILTGAAFNTLLPGSVGGDLVRSWYVCRDQPGKAGVLASIAFDRLVGMASLLLWATATLAVAWSRRLVPDQELRLPTISLATLFGLCLAVAPFVLWQRTTGPQLEHESNGPGVLRLLARIRDSIALYGCTRGPVGQALLLALCGQGLTILAVMALGRGLNLSLRPWSYFGLVPIIVIGSAIPLTPGSIGITEQLYVLYFAPAAGVNGAFALALLARLVDLAPAVVGTILYALGPRLPRTAESGPPTRD